MFASPRRWIAPAWVLMIACIAISARAASPAIPIGPESLRAALFSVPAVSDVTLFSPRDMLQELFLPIQRDGRIASLTLVVPREASLAEEHLASWKSFVSTVSEGDAAGFSLADGVITGRVGGLPVRVVAVKDWNGIPSAGPVILDLGFLLAMYRNEVRTPFVDLPRKFAATLEARKVDAARVQPWIPDNQMIPLEHGYLPQLVTEVLRDPAAFRGEIPPKWRHLRQGEYLAYLSAFDDALIFFGKYLDEAPGEAAVLYRIAQIHFVDGDVERGIRFLHRAFKSDPKYVTAYSDAALRPYRKGEFNEAERILRAGLLLEPGSLELKRSLAGVLLEHAKSLFPVDPASAEERFSAAAGVGLPDDETGRLRAEWDRSKAAPEPSDTLREKPPSHH